MKTFEGLRFNHKHVGVTRPSKDGTHIPSLGSGPDNWKEMLITADIGEGRETYQKARSILLGWRMHSGSEWAGVSLESRVKPVHGDADSKLNVATLARTALRYIWVLNPCRTVYTITDQSFGAQLAHDEGLHHYDDSKWLHTCISYATLSGHLFQGEERMRIIWEQSGSSHRDGQGVGNDDAKGKVRVEVFSVSQGRGLFGKLAFRMGAKMQRKFFQEQVTTVARLVKNQ